MKESMMIAVTRVYTLDISWGFYLLRVVKQIIFSVSKLQLEGAAGGNLRSQHNGIFKVATRSTATAIQNKVQSDICPVWA